MEYIQPSARELRTIQRSVHALYGTYANINNKGAARSSVLYTTPTGMRGGESSSGMEVGVRHSF